MREEEGVYDVEYASSGRAKCKLCFMKIENKSLRISIMVEGPYGESPHWYHMPCFFKKQRPKNISAIAGVDYLKPEDQKKIRKNIGKCSGVVGHCIVKFDPIVNIQLLFPQTRLLELDLALLFPARSDPRQKNVS